MLLQIKCFLKDFLIYSETNVALVALGLGYLSFFLIGQPTANAALLVFISAASFCFYTAERNVTLPKPEFSIFPAKSLWIATHKKLNGFLILSSGLISLVSYFQLSLTSQLGVVIFGAVAATYSIVSFPVFGVRLKEIPALKALLLVATWVFLTLVLPILESETPPVILAIGLVLLWVSWIFANGVFFDIRDIELDHSQGKRTFAIYLGRSKAHRWINGLVALQLVMAVFLSVIHHQPALILALASTACAMFLLNQTLHKRPNLGLSFFIAADLSLTLPSLLAFGSFAF